MKESTKDGMYIRRFLKSTPVYSDKNKIEHYNDGINPKKSPLQPIKFKFQI